MTTTRRDFLLGGATAGAALPLLSSSIAPEWLLAAGASAGGGIADTLVIIQVRGGWDWLNMWVKPDDPVYRAARPTLRLDAGRDKLPLVKTGSPYYWHPAMAGPSSGAGKGGFKELFDSGELAVVQNIGYPGPSLSHFTSEKKWAAGDPSTTKVSSGWLSRWLTGGYKGGFQIPALIVGARVANSFNPSRVPKMNSADSLLLQFDPRTAQDNKIEKIAMRVNAMIPRTLGTTAKDVADALRGAIDDSDLLRVAGSGYRPKVPYPDNRFARQLQLAARYITAGMPTRVYYLNTGGYDTHRGQALANDPLGGRLTSNLQRDVWSVKALLDDLKAHGKADKVVVMLFSEFGRRIGENGSIGTDHGHGGIAFLAGKPVKGGIYGKFPDLSIYSAPYTRQWIRFNQDSTDFRRVYADVLENVLNVRHETILGQRFPLLGAL